VNESLAGNGGRRPGQGRAAFIMGQSSIRTGMTKVGVPGASLGIQPEDPTIAELPPARHFAHKKWHHANANEYCRRIAHLFRGGKPSDRLPPLCF
jgi:arylsulfatase A-like enzyme